MAEVRILVPAAGRIRDQMAADLRDAVLDLERVPEGGGVRIDVWWDVDEPEVWMRTTSGARARWTITLADEGIAFHVRGALGIRLRRPAALRWLVDRLTI